MSAGRTTRSTRAPRPTARRRARRGEGDRLRQEILDATADLLIEHGSAAKVSTRAVAQRVGCSSPALYLHFPDKASLVYAVCEQQFTQLGTLVDEAVAGEDDPLTRLRIAALVYSRFALDHPEQYRIMMMDEEPGLSPRRTLTELAEMAGLTSIVQAVRDGMDRGLFAPGDPMTVTFGLWAAIHGLVSLRLAKPGIPLPPVEDMIDDITGFLANGLRVRPGEQAGQDPT